MEHHESNDPEHRSVTLNEKVEDEEARHVENKTMASESDRAGLEELPITPLLVNGKPYWRTKFFLGTYLALSLSVCGYYVAFSMPSNTLSIIDADIGPSLNITWVSTGFTLTAAVASLFVGRLSDIFGRRYFFIGGSAMGLIGTIVGSTAQTVNQLIGATVLCGLASGTQSAYVYVIAEIVPFKHRYLMIGLINIFTVPVAAFGPLVARALILHTAAGWRWNYYFGIIINGLATILWITCYYPPQFGVLHEQRTKWQQFKRLDFVGLFLFSAGFLLFLLGISWGGSSYPWRSGEVIGTMVSGLATLVAFVFWEIFSGIPEPFLPMTIFRNFQYDIITLIAVIGGMVFYASAVLYPTMIQALFTTDIYRVGVITCAPTAGTCFGLFAGGLFSERIPLKYQYLVSASCLTAFTGALAACGSLNLPMITAFGVLSGFSVGYLELLTEGGATIVQSDQMSLGTCMGIVNTLRTGGGSVAATIYVSILTNRLTSNTESIVVPAVLAAGLPADSVASFLTTFAAGSASAIQSFPGVTEDIITAATNAFKTAYSSSFQTVFLASISFGSLAIIASFFYKEVSHETMQRGVVISLETAAHQDRMIVGEKVLGKNHENYHNA